MTDEFKPKSLICPVCEIRNKTMEEEMCEICELAEMVNELTERVKKVEMILRNEEDEDDDDGIESYTIGTV